MGAQNKSQYTIEKEVLSEKLHQGGNPLKRYTRKVLGEKGGLFGLMQFEFGQMFFSNLGGAIGYLLRRISMASLFNRCGKGLILGRGVTIRVPGHIEIGDNVAIDDHTLLDGGTGAACRMKIGNRVIISKGCVVAAKDGPLEIGDEADIGAHVIIASIGGIVLENNVLIAGNCYLGGARYKLDSLDKPIMYQGIYSRGPLVIGEGTWIGASAMVFDGVTIGKGCVVGAGAVVTKDIPDYSIVVGNPAKVIRTREKQPE